MKRLILILLFFLSFNVHGSMIVQKFTSDGGGCSGAYCGGFSTNCSDTTAGNASNKTGPQTWVQRWVATEDGTAEYINIKFNSTVDTTPVGAYALLYNGDTLVGKGVCTPAADSKVEVTLVAESGQSLDFETDDIMWIGFSFNTGSSGTDVSLLATGSGGEYYYNTNYYTSLTPSTDFTNQATNNAVFWVKYCK